MLKNRRNAQPMRIQHAVFIVAMLCLPSAALAAQTQANAAPAQQDGPTKPPSISSLLQPSLDALQKTVSAVALERWKRGTVRDEAGENINGIQRDLQTNLPPLLKTADSAPGTLSKLLPVSRHIDALYDVLLRVVEAARVSAPGDQASQLEQSLITLGNARRALDDRMQGSAAAVEKQVSDLRNTVQAQSQIKCPVVPAPVTPTCVPPTPTRRARKKPQAPATTPQKSTPQKPTTPATGAGTGTQKPGM
jgi:hypothetical protein